MYKRPLKNDEVRHQALDNDKIKKRVKKHPIELIISTLPQLAVTLAILLFSFYSANASKSDFSGIVFYVSLLSGIVICVVFFLLQIRGAEYKNWKQDKDTRKYIQIASLCSVISFIGFNYSLWSLFYILTPIIILCGFTFVLSVMIIATAFF